MGGEYVMSISLQEIASKVNPIDVAAFNVHRQSVGHRDREICDQCPQPITNMIVKYGEDNYSIKPRKRRKRGIYN
jgi:hypothetical protein